MIAAEAADRRRAMLRTAMGPAIGAALADPLVIEVMVNPDGALRLDRLDLGRCETDARLEPEQVLKDALFIALDGETFVGMSSLWRYGTYLETDFTGVLPAYRGRGVAALMKLRGVRYAQENGFAELRTANDAVNGPMRRLNEGLGFVAQPARLRLEKQFG